MITATYFDRTYGELLQFTTRGLSLLLPDDLPEDARNPLLTAADWPEFERRMDQAGATCVGHYGVVVEGLEVWKLAEQHGWLVMHDDGDGIDAVYYCRSMMDYTMFQGAYISPVAVRIMQEDKYWHWQKEIALSEMEVERQTELMN